MNVTKAKAKATNVQTSLVEKYTKRALECRCPFPLINGDLGSEERTTKRKLRACKIW